MVPLAHDRITFARNVKIKRYKSGKKAMSTFSIVFYMLQGFLVQENNMLEESINNKKSFSVLFISSECCGSATRILANETGSWC